MTATIEKIVSILEEMPEKEVDQVYQITLDTYAKHSPYKKLTKADIMQDLETSRRQYDEGRYIIADSAVAMMRQKYGL